MESLDLVLDLLIRAEKKVPGINSAMSVAGGLSRTRKQSLVSQIFSKRGPKIKHRTWRLLHHRCSRGGRQYQRHPLGMVEFNSKVKVEDQSS